MTHAHIVLAAQEDLRQFFQQLMIRTGALTAPGAALLSCKLTAEKNYAFLEFRSVEETSNATAFDGVAFKDSYLKVRAAAGRCLLRSIQL